MSKKEKISELNLLIEELKERKMEAVKRQDYEAAALHRGHERHHIEARDMLLEESKGDD